MPPDTDPIEARRTAWTNAARAQGLVCLVCHEVPALDDRPTFFDTGLCSRCANELATAEIAEAR